MLFVDQIVSLGLLGRFSQAEALCDRVLVEFPKKKCGYALLIKGLMLLHRYDDNGISHIYDAIRCSKRYFDAGVEAIGTYCCLTGNREQLEVYRSFVDKHIPS